MKKTKTLSCYLRVSKPNEEDQSITSQKEDAIKKAKALGMVYKEYMDNGKGAYKDDNLKFRPAFCQLIEDIKNGLVTDIYCNDNSRLSRNEATDAIFYPAIKKAGVIIHFFDSTIDLNNPSNKLFNTIKIGFVAHETELRKQRFELGMRTANKNGKYLGPNTPYGYEKTKSVDKTKRGILVINEEERKVYLYIVEQYLDGFGCDTIAKRLNSRNILTRSQKKGKAINWNPGTILGMLKNPLYKGERIYNEETVSCPPLITSEVWNKIQEKTETNKIHSKKKGTVHFYLLKGLIKCGCCGRNYFGKIKESSGERLYCCLSMRNNYVTCENKSINIDRIELFIWSLILGTREFYESYIEKYNSENNTEGIKKEIEGLNDILDLREKEYKSLMTMATTATSKRASEVIKKSVEDKEKEMVQIEKDIKSLEAKLNSHFLSSNDLKKAWEKRSLVIPNEEEKTRIVQKIIGEIKITHNKQIQTHHIQIKMLNMPEKYSNWRANLSSKLFTAKEFAKQKADPLAYWKNVEYGIVERVKYVA